MVGPVRAVGISPAGIHCVYSPRVCNRLARPLWARASAGRGQLSLAEGTGAGLAPARFSFSCLGGPEPFHLLAPARPTQLWQAWPAAPPWIDRVRIHWPSDDWPPVDPPVVVEDQVPDGPPQIVIWRETGTLLDMWA